MGEISYSRHILKGFGGKSQHEIKLDRGVASRKGGFGRVYDGVLGYVFVDYIPKALGAGLGSKGQSAFAHALNPPHELLGEVVHPQGGQRNVYLVLLSPVEHVLEELWKLFIIAGRKGTERQLLVSAFVANRFCLSIDDIGRFFPYRAVYIPGLTKSAASYTASENFLHGPVVNDLHKGHNEFFRIMRLVQIFYYSFGDFCRNPHVRGYGGYGAVRFICDRIEGGDIKSLKLGGNGKEKFLSVKAGFFVLPIKFAQLAQRLLPLSQRDDVGEIGQRLGIIGAWASHDHNGLLV